MTAESEDLLPENGNIGRQRPVATIFVAACLGTLSVVAMFGAASLPAPGGWESAPGLLPFAIALLLLVVSAVLVVQSWKQAGRWNPAAILEAVRRDGRDSRAAVLFAALATYISLLLPLMPFELATTCFLVVTALLLARKMPSAGAFAVMVIFPLLFAFVIVGFFDLPIVGDGSIIEPLSEWLRRAVH